jgi:hypothetical protein
MAAWCGGGWCTAYRIGTSARARVSGRGTGPRVGAPGAGARAAAASPAGGGHGAQRAGRRPGRASRSWGASAVGGRQGAAKPRTASGQCLRAGRGRRRPRPTPGWTRPMPGRAGPPGHAWPDQAGPRKGKERIRPTLRAPVAEGDPGARGEVRRGEARRGEGNEPSRPPHPPRGTPRGVRGRAVNARRCRADPTSTRCPVIPPPPRPPDLPTSAPPRLRPGRMKSATRGR